MSHPSKSGACALVLVLVATAHLSLSGLEDAELFLLGNSPSACTWSLRKPREPYTPKNSSSNTDAPVRLHDVPSTA